MARPVQLAPGSLALVLCRLEAQEAADTEEPGGRALFRAFRRANARCFWNSRLARAASRLAFQGWLRRGVLLVQAPPASLQVLRDAWCRRALRPPPGYRIRAVGDVFPVQMNPITQSQFIPLAEVLCCAISDMNGAQMVVTQESLLEHLVKHYPGIAVPSQDILYTTLGTLIKERKIYHTGEGYFIVTPQTYFITNVATQENKRILADENYPMPTSITYLVSMDSCAELARENAAPTSHCQSCQCFPDMNVHHMEESPTAVELYRKDPKVFKESKSMVQNRAVLVSEENHICESTKPLSDSKDREKGKKFGFSLFWRSISRKEKSRTEHCSFSAQFPPEEWPVRDEDNLDNIPRDVEHEIIKRINPILTVDNLIKHTVLMQKYEEQKKCNNQGTSTDMLTSQNKYPSKEGTKKSQGWSGKPRRRRHSGRDRYKCRSQGSEHHPGVSRQEKYHKHTATQPTSRIKTPNEIEVQIPLGENPPLLGSHFIYKKRISNPFQGLSHRGGLVTKGHNIQKSGQLQPSQIGVKGKSFQRSKSLNSPRIIKGGVSQSYAKQHKMKAEPIYMTHSNSTYPQCTLLQSDSKCYSFRESLLTCDVYGGKYKVIPEVSRKCYSRFDTLSETKETQHLLSPGSSHLDQTSSASRLFDGTVHQFKNLGLLDCPVGAKYVMQPENQDKDTKDELMTRTFVQEMETLSLGDEGLSDDDQTLYQNEAGDDDGACSSLYLDEDFSDNDDLCQVLPGHVQYCNYLGKQKMTERSMIEYSSKMHSSELQISKEHEHYKPAGLLTHPDESQKPSLSVGSCDLSVQPPSTFICEEEPSVVQCLQASVPTAGTTCDYYNMRKANPDATALQDSAGDTEKKSASWSQHPLTQETKQQFAQKLEHFNTVDMPVLVQGIQHEHSHLEGTENHSMTGDSGIDSPRTQSLASNNSITLDGLKRRQNFLQNFEDTKNSQTLTPSSLLQLTPVINV